MQQHHHVDGAEQAQVDSERWLRQWSGRANLQDLRHAVRAGLVTTSGSKQRHDGVHVTVSIRFDAATAESELSRLSDMRRRERQHIT